MDVWQTEIDRHTYREREREGEGEEEGEGKGEGWRIERRLSN